MTSLKKLFNSAMRSRISPPIFMTLSCICKNEVPFWVFIRDAAALFKLLSNFIPTANPPASSAGDTIRLPLDKRCKLLVKRLFARLMFSAEYDAAMFEFMTILTLLSSLTCESVFLDARLGLCRRIFRLLPLTSLSSTLWIIGTSRLHFRKKREKIYKFVSFLL